MPIESYGRWLLMLFYPGWIVTKNLTLLIAINKKVEEIRLDPESYKNLNAPMNNLKRVHIGSFVLLFSVDDKTKTIVLENLEHHDDAYN